MIEPGTHVFGPANATLAVRTGRTGAAAKAGHNLLLHVTSWEATLAIGDAASSLVLDADGASLRVIEGTGGLQALGDDDKVSIAQTIDEEVLRRSTISFRSTALRSSDGGLEIEGDLTLAGVTRPLTLAVAVGADGVLRANAVVTQTDFGISPFSTLFGTLRVVDEVEVSVETSPRG